MRQTKVSLEYPYKMVDMKRVFDKSKAGVDITLRLTVSEAEQLAYLLTRHVQIIKEHIENAKKET